MLSVHPIFKYEEMEGRDRKKEEGEKKRKPK